MRLGTALRPQVGAVDPRVRPWYVAAMGAAGVARTDPYVFFTNGKIGNTVAVRSRNGRAVVAADVELDTLSRMLARQRVTPSSRLVLFDGGGRLLGHDDPAAEVVARTPDGSVRPATLAELGDPALARLATLDPLRAALPGDAPLVAHARVSGQDVMLTVARLDLDDRLPVFPSWKPSTTASTKCAYVSRSSSAMRKWPAGGRSRQARPARRRRPACRRSGGPSTTNSPSSPAATWAANR